MRFALIAATLTAAAATPLVLAAAGPQMSGEQFLSAVRCTAYEDVIRPQTDLGELKMRLNSEARRQPAETAGRAQAEVDAIVRQAAASRTAPERDALRQARANACAGAALMAVDAQAGGAV